VEANLGSHHNARSRERHIGRLRKFVASLEARTAMRAHSRPRSVSNQVSKWQSVWEHGGEEIAADRVLRRS